MSGDHEIPMKISKLDVAESVKKCLAELWNVEIGGAGVGYKQKYLSVINENLVKGNQ